MAKRTVVISEEVKAVIEEVARATASAAYIDNAGGNTNYFRAMESLLFNYKKLAALVADEEAYCEVEYHAGKKTMAATIGATGYYQQRTEADIVDEMRHQKAITYQRTKARFDEVDRVVRLFSDRKEFTVIRMYYFSEDADGNNREGNKRLTFEDIATELDALGICKDEKTVRRWKNKTVNDMAVCMFGKPAAVGVGTYRTNTRQIMPD